jgi:hypothetical protein
MRAAAIVFVNTLLIGCVRTSLETSDPRANPEGHTARMEQPATALKPGFDPFQAYPDDATVEPEQGGDPAHHHHHHHGHAGHDMTPADAGTALDAMDHSAHSPAGKAKPSGEAPPKAPASFTCPMHPQIVRDAPGRCPICGMDLVPKKTKSAHPPH